ncbi:UrcA family protein [Blastomonas sp.]|uniref:UrcA family protein n=1 Tax=Blastomonas sp. TaxID=1909299 RepID=UPI002625C2DC|nr:UrcA family protein [Blastomonas sp.]MDM7955866.1 UrcA family protein [Blastomonas sp.]
MLAPAPASFLSRSLAAATATAILFSASVQANPITSVEKDGRVYRSVDVRFVDLDLTTAQGVAALESRLKVASQKVCGAAERAPLQQQMDRRACIQETMASGQRAMVTLVARAEAGDHFKAGERIAVGS